jgi:Tfp pilus assembly protein PilN
MRAVNLLPLDARPGHRLAGVGKEASARRVLSGAGIAAGVVALLFAGLAVYQRGVVEDRRTELQNVETRVVAAEARAARVKQARAASAARLTAFQTVVGQRIAWEDILLDFSRIVPPNVWLQSLQAASPTSAVAGATAAVASTTPAPTTPAAAASPVGFSINGSADSQVRVAQVLDRLALLPWLSGVTLNSSVRDGSGPGSSVKFSIGATLGSTGGR